MIRLGFLARIGAVFAAPFTPIATNVAQMSEAEVPGFGNGIALTDAEMETFRAAVLRCAPAGTEVLRDGRGSAMLKLFVSSRYTAMRLIHFKEVPSASFLVYAGEMAGGTFTRLIGRLATKGIVP